MILVLPPQWSLMGEMRGEGYPHWSTFWHSNHHLCLSTTHSHHRHDILDSLGCFEKPKSLKLYQRHFQTTYLSLSFQTVKLNIGWYYECCVFCVCCSACSTTAANRKDKIVNIIFHIIWKWSSYKLAWTKKKYCKRFNKLYKTNVKNYCMLHFLSNFSMLQFFLLTDFFSRLWGRMGWQ